MPLLTGYGQCKKRMVQRLLLRPVTLMPATLMLHWVCREDYAREGHRW